MAVAANCDSNLFIFHNDEGCAVDQTPFLVVAHLFVELDGFGILLVGIWNDGEIGYLVQTFHEGTASLANLIASPCAEAKEFHDNKLAGDNRSFVGLLPQGLSGRVVLIFLIEQSSPIPSVREVGHDYAP